ncbi:MAG: DUF4239 domain-containing protein [Thermoanaerobaculia bacterium]
MSSVTVATVVIAGSLFLGMLAALELGRRIGKRRLAGDPEGTLAGLGAIEGAVFGLLGLLIAFTFSGAASRFDDRRRLITEEANAIGTAWLRLDTLPAPAQPVLRDLFRSYLDSRLETYRRLPDIKAAAAEYERSQKLQNEIWAKAVDAARGSDYPQGAMLVLGSLNQMIDITTTRLTATRMHPPPIIFVMLGILALASSLLAGFGLARSRRRSWVHVAGFAAVMAITVYVILDIEYPRFGLVRVDAADRVLLDLRRSMS